MKRMLSLLAAAFVLIAAGPSTAEMRMDVYNGATCIGYPRSFSPPRNTAALDFFFFGFRGSASCHFILPDDWRAEDVSAVFLHGVAQRGGDPVRVRLCFYRAYGISISCGAEGTIPATGDFITNVVTPPDVMPRSPLGGYLKVYFPRDRVSILAHFTTLLTR